MGGPGVAVWVVSRLQLLQLAEAELGVIQQGSEWCCGLAEGDMARLCRPMLTHDRY